MLYYTLSQFFIKIKIIIRERKREIAKRRVLHSKKPIKIRDVNVDNIAISKLLKQKLILRF